MRKVTVKVTTKSPSDDLYREIENGHAFVLADGTLVVEQKDYVGGYQAGSPPLTVGYAPGSWLGFQEETVQ